MTASLRALVLALAILPTFSLSTADAAPTRFTPRFNNQDPPTGGMDPSKEMKPIRKAKINYVVSKQVVKRDSSGGYKWSNVEVCNVDAEALVFDSRGLSNFWYSYGRGTDCQFEYNGKQRTVYLHGAILIESFKRNDSSAPFDRKLFSAGAYMQPISNQVEPGDVLNQAAFVRDINQSTMGLNMQAASGVVCTPTSCAPNEGDYLYVVAEFED